MIRNCLRHAAIDRECAAPVTHVFAKGDERRVFIELVDDGFRDAVAQLVDAVLAHGFAVRFQTKARALAE